MRIETIGNAALYLGDCLEVLRTMPDCSVDSIVTDPPYGLKFMGKAWDYDVPPEEVWRECLRVLKPGGHLLCFAGTRTQHRMAVRIEDAGFEIRDMIAWVYSTGFPKSLNLDRERGKSTCGCSRQPVPYAHEKTPGESKAQREVRAVLDTHVPEALDPGKGRGEVLQPRLQEQGASTAGRSEPPSSEVRGQQPGVEGRGDPQEAERELRGRAVCQGPGVGEAYGSCGRIHHGASAGHGADLRVPADSHGSRGPLGPRPVEQPPVEPRSVPDERGPQARGAWSVCAGCGKPRLPEGFGTALKPSLEPITVARKPLVGTVAANVLAHGTGALNIDGCRVGLTGGTRAVNFGENSGSVYGSGNGKPTNSVEGLAAGRWPANLIHDGSDEVLAGFPHVKGATSRTDTVSRGMFHGGDAGTVFDDGGNTSAARFFYCAKASKRDRDDGLEHMEAVHRPNGNKWTDQDYRVARGERSEGRESGPRKNTHPTVKPTALMRYLCRLVTPPGGTVLDPFTGSGSTGKAARLEGFAFIGIERESNYFDIACRRIAQRQGRLIA